MKIITLIVFTGLFIDGLLYAYYLQAPLAALFSVACLALILILLRQWFAPLTAGRLLLGIPVGQAMDIANPDKPVAVQQACIPLSSLNLGTLAIGSQSSGKTESVLLGFGHALKRLLPDAGHAIFEGKGDIDIYKKYVASVGRPDYFFSTELAGSDSINLFDGTAHDVIDRMLSLLIGQTHSTSFFSDNQRDVLMRVVPVLKAVNVATNLRDLYVVLSNDEAGQALLDMARSQNVDPVLVNLFEQWFLTDDTEKRMNVIKGLLNRLFVFVSGPHAARLNSYQPDIRIDKALTNKQRLYFHLPYTEFSVDVATAITEMFAVEARKRQLAGADSATLFPLFFDDWGKFFYDGFAPFQARCRSAKMPLVFSFQSYAQLEEVSPGFGAMMDDMTATKIILRCLGEKTGGYAIRLLDQYERFEIGQSDFGSRETTSLHMRQVFRLSSRDLKALKAGEAYISTLIDQHDQTESTLWKTRLPLPNFDGWVDIDLPAKQTHTEGHGLNFWQRFMNPAHIEEQQKNTLAAARENAAMYQEVV